MALSGFSFNCFRTVQSVMNSEKEFRGINFKRSLWFRTLKKHNFAKNKNRISLRKAWTILLSLYVLALAVTPCGDTLVPDPHDLTLSEVHYDMESGDGHHTGCTPLCTCACCGIIVSIEDLPVYFTPEISEYYLDNFPLPHSFLRGYNHTVLQPPQFV